MCGIWSALGLNFTLWRGGKLKFHHFSLKNLRMRIVIKILGTLPWLSLPIHSRGRWLFWFIDFQFLVIRRYSFLFCLFSGQKNSAWFGQWGYAFLYANPHLVCGRHFLSWTAKGRKSDLSHGSRISLAIGVLGTRSKSFEIAPLKWLTGL